MCWGCRGRIDLHPDVRPAAGMSRIIEPPLCVLSANHCGRDAVFGQQCGGVVLARQ